MSPAHPELDRVSLLLVGDSDIARWPNPMFPQTAGGRAPVTRNGQDGATLDDIVPILRTSISESTSWHQPDILIAIVCAGENDIGSGISLDGTLSSFQELCTTLFSDSYQVPYRYLLFLGPKLEPWLNDDPASRNQYIKLNKAFGRACANHENAHRIIYIDCLTMFCGATAIVPGAILGGNARADSKNFADDQLHLSNDGYRIWQAVVEQQITQAAGRSQV